MKYIYLSLISFMIASCSCNSEKKDGSTANQETQQSDAATVSSQKATSTEDKEVKQRETPKGRNQPKEAKEVKGNEPAKDVKTTPINEPSKTTKKDEPTQTPVVKSDAPQETPLQKAVGNYAKLAEAYRVWMLQSISEGDHEVLQKALQAQKSARKLEPDLLNQQKDFNAGQTATFNAARKKLNKSEADFVKEM